MDLLGFIKAGDDAIAQMNHLHTTLLAQIN